MQKNSASTGLSWERRGSTFAKTIMHDIKTITASFQGDWRAVLEFLEGILLKESVKKVDISRTDDQWKVHVTGLKQSKKPKKASGGLYDLYW